MRVLVVEDEAKLAELISKWLREAGVLADTTRRGEDALWMAAATAYDVIVLDLMLPGIDGLQTCRRLREAGVEAPILILTACDAVDYRTAGLEIGADDYLTKPFDFGELGARLRALARRTPAERAAVLRVGDLTLDPEMHVVRRGDTEISLTTKEVQLLEVFMRHPGELLSRRRLVEGAWDAAHEHHSNVISGCIRSLREKLDRPFGVETIETIRGAGYRLGAA
ncbi:MAG TPA: response regulator transcription factor [Thermoleophilaceae bacterium]|nr:response regulator transcription factor [Thermoleophilaceae bacterium]